MPNLILLVVLLASFNTTFSIFFQPNALKNNPTAIKTICKNPEVPDSHANDQFCTPSGNCLICPPESILKIQSATYGIKNSDACPIVLKNETQTGIQNCAETIRNTKIIKENCQDLKMCKIDLKKLSPLQPICLKESFLSLKIKYSCQSNRIKFHPNVGNTFGARKIKKFH